MDVSLFDTDSTKTFSLLLSKGKFISLQAIKLVTEGQHKHLLSLQQL